MFEGFTVSNVLYLSALIFCIGVYGVLARRNIIVVLMSLELMLNAVNLSLVAFGRAFVTETAMNPHAGQIFTLMVMAVAAAEAAIGLTILLLLFRRLRTIDVRDVCRMQW